MTETRHAADWTPRPLTRTRRDDGAVYRREREVEAQIARLCALPERARRGAITADGRADPTQRLQEETLVYALRECAARGDEETAWQVAERLLERINGHITRQLAKWRLSAEEADDCTRDLFAALFDALFDRSTTGEFWEVRFWVCLDRRLWNLIEKRQARADSVQAESAENDEGEEREALFSRIADTAPGPETLMQHQEALTRLTDNERMAVYLKFIEGLPEESDDPERVTVSKLLGVTGRSVRNYLRRAEAKLREWEKQ